MSNTSKDYLADRLPTRDESRNADQLRETLEALIHSDNAVSLRLSGEKSDSIDLKISPGIAKTFLEILNLVADGKGFRLTPLETDLSTQQAADLLNVSRPYLIRLLEEGLIPFTKTGRHRRISAERLLAFKATRDAERAGALSEIAQYDSDKGYL